MNDYIEFEKNAHEDCNGEPLDELQEIEEEKRKKV